MRLTWPTLWDLILPFLTASQMVCRVSPKSLAACVTVSRFERFFLAGMLLPFTGIYFHEKVLGKMSASL